MKFRPNIMIDMDGVLADFWWGFTEIATKLGYMDKPVSTVDQEKYDWHEEPLMKTNIWKEIKASGSYWVSLPPLVTIQDSLALASLEKKSNLYFVTARVGYRCKQQTEIFLARMGIYAPTVIVLKHQHGLPHGNSHVMKYMIAMSLGADYSIEDRPINAREIGNYSPCQSYLLTQPYNAEDEWGLRVKTVGEFLDKVEADERWQTGN